jgi:hypothetical protein
MLAYFSSFFNVARSIRKLFLLFLITFFIKLSCLLYLIHLSHCFPGADFRHRGFIAWVAGDTPTYLDPVDNYLNKGEFYSLSSSGEKIHIGRGPYYGVPYFLFRLFFNQTPAYNLYALFQIALASLAVLYYCLLCRLVVRNYIQQVQPMLSQQVQLENLAFGISFILFNVSLNTTIWDNELWTESIHLSLFAFFAYHYFNYVNERRKDENVENGNSIRYSKSFFYSALFLALITLIKPYFCLVYVGVGIELLVSMSFWKGVKKAAAFAIPLVVATLPWTIRNVVKYQRLVPVQEHNSYHWGKATFAYWNFLGSWGGSATHWDKRSAGCYFEPSPVEACEFVFPDYVFTKQYGMKDIEEVRNDFVRYQGLVRTNSSPQTTSNEQRTLEDTIAAKFNRLTATFKQEKPFFYYVVTPLLCAKKMIFHSGSYYLPIGKNSSCYKPRQMLIKLSQSALYYLMLIFGWWGLIQLMRIKGMTLLAFIPLYLVFLLCFYLRATEFRYFDTTYPFFIIGFVYLLITTFRFRPKCYK